MGGRRQSVGSLVRAVLIGAAPWLAGAPLAGQTQARVVLGPELGPHTGVARALGNGWSNLWTDTVTLPVLLPDTLGDGITAERTGEGEFAGYVLRDGRGRTWRLVPVRSDPIPSTLPSELRGTALSRALEELTATVHPTAPPVVNRLYEAVGLPVVPVRAAVVGSGSGVLGDVSGVAVWLEEAPALSGGAWNGFARVLDSDAAQALWRSEPALRVDLEAYLAARLVDLVVGDRDRRPAHWLWGERSGVWVPIGVRHDEAMQRAEGLDRYILTATDAGYARFGAKEPNVGVLTRRSYDLDRPLLARLDRARWDAVAQRVRAALTDAAIDDAVAAMPAEHQAIAAEYVREALRYRRDALDETVDELYEFVMHWADLRLSDGAETVTLRRTGRDLNVVVVAGGQTVLDRTFRTAETHEVRLYLGGGDDVVSLEGVSGGGVGVRISSGAGRDRYEVAGGVRRIVAYDDPAATTIVPAGGIRIVPRNVEPFRLWQEDGTRAPHLDWGVRKGPVLDVDLNKDLGLVVGGGMQFTWDGFDEPVYRQRARFSAAYATKPGRFRVAGSFERRDVLRNIHLQVDALASGIELVRWFGLGNGTEWDQDLDETFYNAPTRQVAVTLTAGLSRSPTREFRIGPAFVASTADTANANRLVAVEDPYGAGDFVLYGGAAFFRYDPERRFGATGLTANVDASAEYVPAWGDAIDNFGGVRGQVRGGWVPAPDSRLALAARLGGAVLWGTVPFSRTARVGGPGTLRGYQTDRFAGDRGSLYGSVEARVRLFRLRLAFAPLDLGVLGFGDAGRVYSSLEDEPSDLHPAFGGGLWISPALGWLPQIDALLGRIEIAHGDEQTLVSVGTGFRF